jgi:molybdenum cofactor cytidylyltransferase
MRMNHADEREACGVLPVTVVVLAAGSAHRMGRQKLVLPIEGVPLVRRVVLACDGWPTVAVVSDADVAATLAHTGVRIVGNDAPERGMNWSLALADAAVRRNEAIAVMLGDTPDCDPVTVARVINAYDETVDVVAPEAAGRLGHPVVFGPRARAAIAGLADGDALRTLRDDPAFVRRIVTGFDAGAFADIDTPAEYEARTRGALPEG